MMIREFERRTGYYPTLKQYEAIERAYEEFNGDKDAFCEAYKNNAEGIAERIQFEADTSAIKQYHRYDAEIARRDAKIKYLKEMLDQELEWKPYEFTMNVQQAEYAKLVEGISTGAAHYMTDGEALDWICGEFGFDRRQVTILHEIDEQEINRHNHCRASGRKIDRRPVYCATDYHYIRFNVGRGEWQWEAWNGKICPFYD